MPWGSSPSSDTPSATAETPSGEPESIEKPQAEYTPCLWASIRQTVAYLVLYAS